MIRGDKKQLANIIQSSKTCILIEYLVFSRIYHIFVWPFLQSFYALRPCILPGCQPRSALLLSHATLIGLCRTPCITVLAIHLYQANYSAVLVDILLLSLDISSRNQCKGYLVDSWNLLFSVLLGKRLTPLHEVQTVRLFFLFQNQIIEAGRRRSKAHGPPAETSNRQWQG